MPPSKVHDPDNIGEAVDDKVDAEAQPEAGPEEETGRPRRWRAIALGAVATVVTVAAVVLLVLTMHQARTTDRLERAALDTARDYLVAMATFDYEQLDANQDFIAANSTPEFAGRYQEMVQALRDIVVASQGQATATADRIAVERLDDRSATVIAFVDQQVTNVTSPQGNTQRYRMTVDLIRSGDRWIVDNVETV